MLSDKLNGLSDTQCPQCEIAIAIDFPAPVLQCDVLWLVWTLLFVLVHDIVNGLILMAIDGYIFVIERNVDREIKALASASTSVAHFSC